MICIQLDENGTMGKMTDRRAWFAKRLKSRCEAKPHPVADSSRLLVNSISGVVDFYGVLWADQIQQPDEWRRTCNDLWTAMGTYYGREDLDLPDLNEEDLAESDLVEAS